MKKRYSLLRSLAAVILMAVSACVLTSCEKDNISPDIPGTVDQYHPLSGQGSVTFNSVGTSIFKQGHIYEYATEGGKVCHLVLYFTNNVYLNFMFNAFDGDSVTLTNRQFQLGNPASYEGYYCGFNTMFFTTANYPFTNDSEITIVRLGDGQYHIYGQGRVVMKQGAKTVEFDLEGGLYDQDHPTGSGTMSEGDECAPLSLALCVADEQNKCRYRFFDWQSGKSIVIYSHSELTSDMPVSAKAGDVSAGTHVRVAVSHEGAEELDYLDGGMLHVTRHGDVYALVLEDGPVWFRYEGIVMAL